MGKWAERNLGLLVTALVFVTLLLFYTAYDKQAKTIVPEKLVKVVSFSDAANSMKEMNKVGGLAAIGLIAISLLIGPLSRMFPKWFASWLMHRKFIGIAGFASAVFHSVYSLLVIYGADVSKMILENPKWAGILSAMTALLIFIVMAITSNQNSVKKMGYKIWKAVQTFGYVGLALAALHFIILETKPGIGLDVRPYGLLFLVIPLVALVVRAGIIFIRAPERSKFEHHIGEEHPKEIAKQLK